MAKNYKEYNDLGVRFIYPNNWQMQAQTWDKNTHTVSLDSPAGNFWALGIYPLQANLEEIAQSILREMYSEYSGLEIEEIKRYVAEQELKGFEINFFFLDMASVAQALIFRGERNGYVIYWQTLDDLGSKSDDVSYQDVFDVVTHTLIANLTGVDIDFWEEDEPMTPEELRAAEQEEDLLERQRRLRRAGIAWEEHAWRTFSSVHDVLQTSSNDDEHDDPGESVNERLKPFLRDDSGKASKKRDEDPEDYDEDSFEEDDDYNDYNRYDDDEEDEYSYDDYDDEDGEDDDD
ncbi:MAG: hypothetical protein Q4G03_04525 [Planctomycetia bacterium]|nr:hypothetical protein [Planctomycetia bacterium]